MAPQKMYVPIWLLDKIYSSPSQRAKDTAQPTCDLLKKNMELVDFADEALAWEEFTVEKNGYRTWLFQDEETRMLFSDKEIVVKGHRWYEDDRFKEYKKGVERIAEDASGFFKSLGYAHIREKIGRASCRERV